MFFNSSGKIYQKKMFCLTTCIFINVWTLFKKNWSSQNTPQIFDGSAGD